MLVKYPCTAYRYTYAHKPLSLFRVYGAQSLSSTSCFIVCNNYTYIYVCKYMYIIFVYYTLYIILYAYNTLYIILYDIYSICVYYTLYIILYAYNTLYIILYDIYSICVYYTLYIILYAYNTLYIILYVYIIV